MEEMYRKQIKILKELYEGTNKELEIANKIIDYIVPKDYYKIIKLKAIQELEEN